MTSLSEYYKKWERIASDLGEEAQSVRPGSQQPPPPGALPDSAALQAAARAQAQAEAAGPLDPSKISYSFGKPMSEAEFLAYRKTRAGAGARVVGTSTASV